MMNDIYRYLNNEYLNTKQTCMFDMS